MASAGFPSSERGQSQRFDPSGKGVTVRVGVLSNPSAGLRHAKIDRISNLVAGHGDVLHIETANGAEVGPALDEMAKRRMDVVVLNGGDGTVQHALTYLLRDADPSYRPWLAPVCGGRTNTIARDLGARRDPARGLADLMSAVAAGRMHELAVSRAVVRVEIEEGVHYGMFLGFGMLHRAVRLVHEAFPPGRARGSLGAGVLTATLVIRAILSNEPGGILASDELEVMLDGRPLPARIMRMAMVTTMRRLFFGLVPFFGDEPAPLRSTFVEAGSRHPAWAAARVLLRRPGPVLCPENGYHSQNVHRLDVRLDGGLILDGELFDGVPGRRVRVTAAEDVRWLRA